MAKPLDKSKAPTLTGTMTAPAQPTAPVSIEQLRPWVALLPERTPVNLNTAERQVLAAVGLAEDFAGVGEDANLARPGGDDVSNGLRAKFRLMPPERLLRQP